jgi:hypothetical protein
MSQKNVPLLIEYLKMRVHIYFKRCKLLAADVIHKWYIFQFNFNDFSRVISEISLLKTGCFLLTRSTPTIGDTYRRTCSTLVVVIQPFRSECGTRWRLITLMIHVLVNSLTPGNPRRFPHLLVSGNWYCAEFQMAWWTPPPPTPTHKAVKVRPVFSRILYFVDVWAQLLPILPPFEHARR